MLFDFCLGIAVGLMLPYILHRFVIPQLKKKIKKKIEKW